MSKTLSRLGLLAVAGLAFAGVASAQSPNGFASIIHVPIAANTGIYQSTIFVHNPSATATNVQVNYYGATGTASAGTVDCGVHSTGCGAYLPEQLLCLVHRRGSDVGFVLVRRQQRSIGHDPGRRRGRE